MDAELMKESLESKIGEMDIEESNAVINRKLRLGYDGKIVRKDLTKHIKEGANVPVYVLEYLLGQYCNSEDEEITYLNSLKKVVILPVRDVFSAHHSLYIEPEILIRMRKVSRKLRVDEKLHYTSGTFDSY